jgi:CopA family copper-resistance protein
MDGVPGLSFRGIHPGETFTYKFKVRQHGTYWYHSHSGFDEQLGLYGALVIDPAEPSPVRYDREHVVLLSDWTDEDPRAVLAKLKKQSDYFNFNKRTVGDFLRDVREKGWTETLADRRMWGQMRMNPTDLSDVTGATYTYLMNGNTPHGNWTGLFKPGERVRLRFINGSSQSYFDVRIPGLKLTVIAVKTFARLKSMSSASPPPRLST